MALAVVFLNGEVSVSQGRDAACAGAHGAVERSLFLIEDGDFLLRNARITIILCLLGIGLGILNVLGTPCFVVSAAGERVALVEARPELPFSIHFIQSVQKTPVLENLEIRRERDGFDLLSTKYQSFGVGLPFLAEEGDFRQEGDYYVFDHMHRHFPQLQLRTGVGTRLTLNIAGREYRLYERYAPGTRIDLYIAPLYRALCR